MCIQSDDTDGTTANEDEALRQQPNNTRASVPGTLGAGSKQSPREITLSSKARYRTVKIFFLKTLWLWSCITSVPPYSSDREKLYEEKLRQQKQELKMLHEERQKLIEIQGKIQDLQWACPDLQVLDSY